jgi:hydroxyacylglutathione hydrolase/adenylyltransferase/sulfurtransferase
MPSPSTGDTEVTPEQAQQALADGSALLVDVREDYEWEAGRIDGAEHIELTQLPARAEELPQDRTLIFVCRVGARSAMAADAFGRAGFEARTMAGGMVRWDAEGRPIVPEGGTVAPH